ncbi:MAG: hypothetical protein KAH54_02915 [Candidatus Sabulitectum sp.]|nr:hypothetical protein [Candidatus Sabulitectum sp.]
MIISSLILLAGLLAGPSRYTSVDVQIEWDGSAKETTVTYRATAGDDGRFLRVTRDFDPEYMEIEVLSSTYGFPGQPRDVPEWAVDTLTGGEGWPLALVVAFPGLRPGMDIEWSFRVLDEGKLSSEGLFYTYIAGEVPDTITVSCPDMENLSVGSIGFTETTSRGRRIFTSSNEACKELWLSTASDWEDVLDILLGPSRASSMETPPDLREAAIEAGAAGALPRMRVSRGRVLITESMQLLPFPGGDAGFSVRTLQEILDSRRATPVEAATLLSAMCGVMGIEAPVVPATDILPLVPSPLGFFRSFILVDGELEEPSEYLSPAGWVDAPDTLWLLLPGGVLAEMPPLEEADHCIEEWDISPSDGLFSVTIQTEGGFDRELRRKLAGLDSEEILLTISDWFRSSGIYFYPLSVQLSDLYDLTEPAWITVNGLFPPAGESWIETAPSLNWNREGIVTRDYTNVNFGNGVINR